MKKFLFTRISIVIVLLAGLAFAGKKSFVPAETEMVSLANNFINLLDQKQKEKAVYPFEDNERFDWHYVPRKRNGITFHDMDQNQHEAAMALMKSGLSEQGYQKAKGILALEDILRKIEERGKDDNYRDHDNYSFTIFGTPSNTSPWGWRVEGHHLALNFCSVSKEVSFGTPSFFGSNPGIVPSGPEKGLQILKEEQELARKLALTMNESQLKKLVIATDAPSDIITKNNRKAEIAEVKGISYSEMNKSQQALFIQLLEVYIKNYNKEISDGFYDRIKNTGIEKLNFAWAGSFKSGEGHYYRIQGPLLLIEYDNTQSNANHVHTVVRDLQNDFGGDALLNHYKNAH